MHYTLAVDQGTHASRALLFDDRGQAIASHLVPVGLTRPQPGQVEQDAAEILAGVRSSIDAVLQTLPADQRHAVAACGLTTQRSTVLSWERDGSPASPALSWQDTRGAAQVADLQTHADAIRRLSGLPLSPHYGASKLHWLLHASGEHPERRLGPLAAFLLDNLSDSSLSQIDHSNAQRMQLFDIRQRDWSATLLDWFDIPAGRLPVCAPVMHDFGRLRDHAIPLTAVCGDQNAAWFGEGNSDPACALVNMGSGAFILARQPDDAAASRLLTSIATSDARDCEYLIEGTVNGAGSALLWLHEQYGGELSETMLADWLVQVDAPPLFINSVGGLGSPWWRTDIAPAFEPEHGAYTLAQRAVAVAESILFLLQHNLEHIPRADTLRRLRVSGGLSRVEPLCQKLANLSGLPVHRARHEEASARGVAWLAAGRPSGWTQATDTRLFVPAADDGLKSRYRRFVEQLHKYVEAGAID